MVVNPAAGRGAGRRAADPVARAFRAQGWAVELCHTDRPGHGVELAAAAVRAGAHHVIAVGGDGTVHEVANGLLACGGAACLGVVPIGTGNDFAKLVGTYRHDPARAVARLVGATPRRFDAGRVLDEYFVNTMGLGFGPEVVRAREAHPSRTGLWSYIAPVPRAFIGFRPFRCEIRSPEQQVDGYMMMVEVCNGTTAGGAYRFAPDADPMDGYLDVCLVGRLSWPRFVMAVPRVMRGRHTTMKEVTVFRTRELTLATPDAPLLLHLDGELRSSPARQCTVRVERGTLNVLVAR
ncbi:MAG TPA: YegS/Rv2252/BmrU family lipid kinase [Gemmatimonadales bacterium]|nr:YegS/Rv2252/BmrU family lipid kinase [Gemmatimonadales bacterium]